MSDKLSLENVELRSALQTFRNLYECSIDTCKTLKIVIEKNRSELSNYKGTIRDLQSSSDEKNLIGKLYHQVMLSKWREGQIAHKYERYIDENRKFKMEIKSVDVKIHEKEDEISEIFAFYNEKVLELEKQTDTLKMKFFM